MSASRRSVLAAAGAGLASLEIAGATRGSALACAGPVAKEVSELIRQSAESNAALMRGDINRYLALITLTDDFTLMSPFGGTPSRGSDMTGERWEAMGRFFRNGALQQEIRPVIRLSRHGGSCDHRTSPCRGRRSAGPGLVATRHPGLSPRRVRMAAGASACRPPGRGHQPGTGSRDRSGRACMLEKDVTHVDVDT